MRFLLETIILRFHVKLCWFIPTWYPESQPIFNSWSVVSIGWMNSTFTHPGRNPKRNQDRIVFQLSFLRGELLKLPGCSCWMPSLLSVRWYYLKLRIARKIMAILTAPIKTNPPNGRNKGLIAGLMRANQWWLITPDHEPLFLVRVAFTGHEELPNF